MPRLGLSRTPSTNSTHSRITVAVDNSGPASDGLASTPPTSVTDAASVSSASNVKDGPAKAAGRIRRVGTGNTSYNENVLSSSTRAVHSSRGADSASPSKTKSTLGKRARDGNSSGARRPGDKKRRVSRRLVEVEKQKERDVSDSPKKQTRQAVAEASQPAAAELKPIPKKPKATARSKKYLAQGLYVGQDPNFDPRFTEEKNKKKLAAKAAEPPSHRMILPDPMLAGKRLLDIGRGFRLPFNVFSPLPPGQPRPDEWRKTQKNVFVGDAADFWRTTKRMEHSTCICAPEDGCDEHCLNRYMFYECDGNNCTVGAGGCTNRAFEDLRRRCKAGGKFNIGVDVIKTSDRGSGVRSNRCFAPNQIIMEYTGEIITQDECDDRMRHRYKENECFYLMMFDQNMIIDATRGSIARFVNHSCEPNCRMEKWTVAGKPRMALFAGDDGIVTGEELTYDYNFDPFSSKNIQECRCGSSHCRGVLGPRRTDKDIKDALKPLTEAVPAAVAGAKRKLAQVVAATAAAVGTANKKRKVAVPKSLKATSKTLKKGAALTSKSLKTSVARTSKSLKATTASLKTTAATTLSTAVAAAMTVHLVPTAATARALSVGGRGRTKQTTLEAFAKKGIVQAGGAPGRLRGPGRPRKDGGVKGGR